MLQGFHNTTQVGPEINIFCYNCNDIDGGYTYMLITHCAGSKANDFYDPFPKLTI